MGHTTNRPHLRRWLLAVICLLALAMLGLGAVAVIRHITHYADRAAVESIPETPAVPAVEEDPYIEGLARNVYDGLFYQDGNFVRYEGYTPSHIGVDVSAHQQQIDWQQVADSGVEFAMVRAGYRGYTKGDLERDAYFTQNVDGAAAAGLDVGVYFFSQAITTDEALEEADLVLELLDGRTLAYPIVFDWEDIEADARTDGMTSPLLTEIAAAFCARVEAAGYQSGIYFNQRFGYQEFDLLQLQGKTFWLAEYNIPPTFAYDFQIWQYTNDGTVPGISTPVDLNLSFGDWGASNEDTEPTRSTE